MVRNVVGRWLGTAGLVVLMASMAPAQERGQGQGRGGAGGFGAGGFGAGGFGGGKIGLVQNEQVQQELKLTDEQKSKVSEVATRVREAGPQRGQGGGGEANREQLRERMQAMSRVVAEEEKKLDEILNDEQKKRLDQISLQVTGVRALMRDEVASKLGLSDDQKEKVQAALRPQRGQAGGGQGQQRPDAAALRERREQQEQQVLAVLNDEQKQKWEELKGEAFELQRRGGAGQRRGGGEGRRPQN